MANEEEWTQAHEEEYRIAIDATSNMLDKLDPRSPETFYGSLIVILHHLFIYAPSMENALNIIRVALQNELTEDDFHKYFKKAFRTDPFFAHQSRVLN